MSVYLIRHGESHGNVDKNTYATVPDHLITLTELGEKQAYKTGEELYQKIKDYNRVFFYVSPFYRTRQTYYHIKKALDDLGYTGEILYNEDVRLIERKFGNLVPAAESRELWEEVFKFSEFYAGIPNGESCLEVFTRIKPFWNEIKKITCGPVPIVIVGHGTAIRVLEMAIFGWTVEQFEQSRHLANGEIKKII